MHALHILFERGLSVAVEGDRLVVAPAHRLDDALRQYIRSNKPVLVDLIRTWAVLESAINACCDARRDTPENRAALLADAWHEPADSWAWLTAYFNGESARYTH